MREPAARMVQSDMPETTEGRWLTFCLSLRCPPPKWWQRCVSSDADSSHVPPLVQTGGGINEHRIHQEAAKERGGQRSAQTINSRVEQQQYGCRSVAKTWSLPVTPLLLTHPLDW